MTLKEQIEDVNESIINLENSGKAHIRPEQVAHVLQEAMGAMRELAQAGLREDSSEIEDAVDVISEAYDNAIDLCNSLRS